MKYFLLALMLLAPVVAVMGATRVVAVCGTGNPRGQPVILLHGYSDSWFSYSRILPLVYKKYHVYVPDQRGHGDSDRPAGGYTFPDFAADVLAFIDAKGLKQATIVGHSMRSFVAAWRRLLEPPAIS